MTEPLSRIPLSKEEELTMGSMSRWMRFMSIVGICGALVMLVVIVLASGVYSSIRGATHANPEWAKAHTIFETLGALPYGLAAVFLLLAGIAIWQNMTLFHAGDDFNLVATTDTADVEYLSRGLDRLKTFFKIQVLTVAVTLTVVLVTGLVVAMLAGRAGATS